MVEEKTNLANSQGDQSKYKAKDTWGRKLQIMYKFPQMVQKHFMFRAFRNVPFSLVNAATTPIGTLISKIINRKIDKSFRLLMPAKILKKGRLNKWKVMVGQYAINLFIEITFFLSNQRFQYYKYNRIEGFEHIQNALQQKKGVLIPSIHMGEFLHTLSTLMVKRVEIDGKKQPIQTAGLSSPYNKFLYEEFERTYEHVHMVVAEDFKTTEEAISGYLKQNCAIFILIDYSKASQFRVPFIYDYPSTRYLYPMPQLLTHLHLTYDAPIVPSIIIPQQNIAHSVVRFMEPVDIKEPIPKLEGKIQEPYLTRINKDIELIRTNKADKKTKVGMICLKLFRKFYPYVLKMPYYWEELLNYPKRVKNYLVLDTCATYPELLFSVCEELDKLIDNSYEPGRKDKDLKKKLLDIRLMCERMPDDEEQLKSVIKNRRITITKLSGVQTFEKVIDVVGSYMPANPSPEMESIQVLFKSLTENFYE